MGRAATAAAVTLVLAPVAACSTVAAPSAPRTPAPVQAPWPGCEAVGAFASSDGWASPEEVGGVPEDFTATTVVLCEEGERQDARGDTVRVGLERTSSDVGPLLTYLAQPSERPSDGPCTADAWLPPWLVLLDADGRYVAPDIPVDGCGKPLGWSTDRDHLPWTMPAYTDRVVHEGDVTESAEAKRTGCSMGGKDVVEDYATSSHRRTGGFGKDLPGGRALRVCVYEVPDAERRSDAPGGELLAGRTLDGQDRAAFDEALRAAPETAAACATASARFAVVAAHDAGPTLYVELDGCRRVVSDGETTPVVRAGDDLVALLGG